MKEYWDKNVFITNKSYAWVCKSYTKVCITQLVSLQKYTDGIRPTDPTPRLAVVRWPDSGLSMVQPDLSFYYEFSVFLIDQSIGYPFWWGLYKKTLWKAIKLFKQEQIYLYSTRSSGTNSTVKFLFLVKCRPAKFCFVENLIQNPNGGQRPQFS